MKWSGRTISGISDGAYGISGISGIRDVAFGISGSRDGALT